MRVLLIAPTIDRDDVGEAWVAYQWASRLAVRHDLTVLTYRKRGRPPVVEQLPPGTRVVEWEEPAGLGRAERLNSLLKPAYLPFYIRARRWVRRALVRGEHFDLVHQPVPVAMRYPSPAAGLGIPLVVGPQGGGLASPPGFDAEDTAPWYTRLRAVDRIRLQRDPMLRRTYESASCVLGIAPYVLDHLRGLDIRRFAVLGETGLTSVPPEVVRPTGDGRVRLLFVGRLIRTKGARDAIAALSHLSDLDVSLDVVGDGFDRPACAALVSRGGLDDRVTFHGAVPHEDVAAYYERADVFVFPSYREPGGNVVFEAMGASLPLVVSDRGGPGYVVDDSCGIRVTPVDPGTYALDLAAAIRVLVTNPDLRRRLGAGARRRLSEVGLWETKLDIVDDLYRSVADR